MEEQKSGVAPEQAQQQDQSQPAPQVADKELNFARLRKAKEAADAEAQRLRQEKEELLALRAREREELDRLKAEFEVSQIESSYREDDPSEDPESFVSIAKLREKERKLAAKHALVIKKERAEMQREMKNALEEMKAQIAADLSKSRVVEESESLLQTYGEDAIQKELEENKLLRIAAQYMPDDKKIRFLHDHFREKAEAARLLNSDNVQRQSGFTGVANGVAPDPKPIAKLTRVSAKDWVNPTKAAEMGAAIRSQIKNA